MLRPPRSTRPDPLVPYTTLVRAQKVRHLEGRLLNKQGGYSWITWTISSAHDNFYLVGRDDTDFKQQARQLRQAQAALLQSQKMEAVRSEEHTSELQSLMRISYAVFCLKTKTTNSKFTKIYT